MVWHVQYQFKRQFGNQSDTLGNTHGGIIHWILIFVNRKNTQNVPSESCSFTGLFGGFLYAAMRENIW